MRNGARDHNVFIMSLLSVYFYLSLPICHVFRYKRFAERLAQLEEAEGTFDRFTLSYQSFGIQRRSDNALVLREWAPGAEAVLLTGDFSKHHHNPVIRRSLPVTFRHKPFLMDRFTKQSTSGLLLPRKQALILGR